MIDAGFPQRTLESWQSPAKVADTKDARIKWFNYEYLKPAYKALVKAKYGDPYEFATKEPLLSYLKEDYKAEQFFETYELPNGQMLKDVSGKNYVQEYTKAASWLNLIEYFLSNKKALKELGLTTEQFWDAVCKLLEVKQIDLPWNKDALRKKVKKYHNESYKCIISGRFGNTNTMKIGKTSEGIDADVASKQIAVIRKAASLHMNMTPEEVTVKANILFEKNGWTKLSRSTIARIMAENEHLTTAGSRGKRVYNSTIARQVLREAPHYPYQMVTVDGWTVELLYQDETGFSNRLVMVVILDPMNKYPLGYAIGDRENVALIQQAMRNAILHGRELFGNYYRPWQVQSDHYGIKQMTPFYAASSHLFTPAAVGNAKSKVIEPYFKDLNKKYAKFFPNWSGFNLTAKQENQPNREYLDMIKHSFPNKDGVITQIEWIMKEERTKKGAEYLEKWQQIPEDLKPPVMNEQQMITVFGQKTGEKNSIVGAGLVVSINSKKITYDTFDPAFRALRNMRFVVTFLPDNLEKVVATTEDGKHAFLLDKTHRVGMSVIQTTPEDYEYRSKIKAFNKEREAEIMKTYVDDDAQVQEVLANTPLNITDGQEAMIKLMFTHKGQQKEGLQDAKMLGKARQIKAKQMAKIEKKAAINWQDERVEYLDSKADFNQYLD